MNVYEQLHASATHGTNPNPNCPICNPIGFKDGVFEDEDFRLGKQLARSLFEYKGNPASFDCMEEQLARIIQGSIDWADQTRDSFEKGRS